MSTTARGQRDVRVAAATVSLLAVLGLGLAGCQTGADRDAVQDGVPSLAQIERTARAAQARYEGQAEYYAELDRLNAQRAAQDRYDGHAEFYAQLSRMKSAQRAAQAAQDRYEGQAEYYARLAERGDASTPTAPVVADRLDPR